MDRARGTADGSGRPIDGILHHADGVLDADRAWQLLLAVRRCVDGGEVRAADGRLGFSFVASACRPDDPDRAELVVDLPGAVLARSRRALDPAAAGILELHLSQALCTRAQGHLVAILGQSLDGFIATRQGQSRYINGDGSLVHLHRLRALSDAVVIGVGTAVADGPRLTTRHVPGPHATRVVIDPRGRLPADSGLLSDGVAPTLIVRATHGREAGETRLSTLVSVLHLPVDEGGIAPARLVAALAARGLTRLLVEGGGVTVGRFLEAGLLHRLQLAVSPLILGAGRPALPVAPVERLDEALRPACRHYRMGEDILFDLRLRPSADGQTG
jgi:riboflavin-specific deaminase-like protein